MTPRTCRKAVFLSPFSSQFAECYQITPIPSENWKPFLSNKWTRYRKYRLVIPFFTLSSGGCIYAHIWSSKVHLLTNPFFDIRLVVSPTDLELGVQLQHGMKNKISKQTGYGTASLSPKKFEELTIDINSFPARFP